MLSHISHALRNNGSPLFNPALKEGLMGSKSVRPLTQELSAQTTKHSHNESSDFSADLAKVWMFVGGALGGLSAIGIGRAEREPYRRDVEFEKNHKTLLSFCQTTSTLMWSASLVPSGALAGWIFGKTIRYGAPMGLAAMGLVKLKNHLEILPDVKNQ